MKKSFISFLLVLCLVLSAAFYLPAAGFAAEKGDVDGSGGVSSADARIVLRAAVGLQSLSAAQFSLADMDGNGYIEASDARLVLRKAVGLAEQSEYDVLRSGSFYMIGEMTDNAGVASYMEIACTPDTTYAVSDLDGVRLAVFVKNEQLYLLYPEKSAYLHMDEELMNTSGMSIEDFIGDTALSMDFPPLSSAERTYRATLGGKSCTVYVFNESGSLTEIFISGNELVRVSDRSFTLNVESVSASIPEEMRNIPSRYTRYSGMLGMLAFMALLPIEL